jgi:60 kDa SS-A/Ro ribonucleoprotein
MGSGTIRQQGQKGFLIRNLRNMKDADVPEAAVRDALAKMKTERILPFRFISAARYAPHLEDALEQAMFRCVSEVEKLKGKTAIVVDNSGSMGAQLSNKSEMTRIDAACGLAILCREICEQVVVIGFGYDAKVLASRRGMALRDAIQQGPGGGTNTQFAIRLAQNEGYDRIIVITDEQSHQTIDAPQTKLAYFVNVGTFQNGIGYGAWTHIDGWSESIIDYIRESEKTEL